MTIYYDDLVFAGLAYKPPTFGQNATPGWGDDLVYAAPGQFGPTFSLSLTGGHATGTIAITATGIGTTWGGSNPFSVTVGGGFASIANYVRISDTSATFNLVLTSLGGTVTISDSNSGTTQNYSAAAIAPGAPTIGTLTDNHDGTITITFTPPADNGGAAITTYTATDSVAGSNTGSASPITISGITKGSSQTVSVTATNSVGTSSSSSASNAITPITVPGVPTSPVATRSTLGQASVAFNAPADNGGGAITGYTVVSTPAGGVDSNAGGTGTTHTMTGLSNATAYTFHVVATNSYGASAASAESNSITTLGFTFTPSGDNTTGVKHITAVGYGTNWGVSNPFAIASGPGSTLTNYANVDATHATFDFTVTAVSGVPVVISDSDSGTSRSFSTRTGGHTGGIVSVGKLLAH